MNTKNKKWVLTVEEYYGLPESEISYPVNGGGLEMPQLIDDLLSAKTALRFARAKLNQNTPESSALHNVESALGRINRSLQNLGIKF